MTDPGADRRRLWRSHWRRYRKHVDRLEAEGRDYESFEPLPDDLQGLTCGARTRAGTPCRRVDLSDNGRCRLHGGLSTGPRTKEGKAAARANLARRWGSEPHDGLNKTEHCVPGEAGQTGQIAHAREAALEPHDAAANDRFSADVEPPPIDWFGGNLRD